MRNIKYILILAITFSFLTLNAQEKKIKFNKGTLKICSSKNFQIEGYDGKEIIIKSLHEKRNSNLTYAIGGTYSSNNSSKKNLVKSGSVKKNNKNKPWVIENGVKTVYNSDYDSISPKFGSVFFHSDNADRKEGLKKLGKKNENSDLGIYFVIEQKDGELIFKDQTDRQLVMMSNERYEIKIPNSIKLNWETSGCKESKDIDKKFIFFNSKASSLSNFDGEVEISTSLNNMKLLDVTGPVSINSIGGNVTVEFDKKIPKKLYSIYSNNGFIDVTLPANSDVIVDANSSSIFSDIDFNVLEDTEKEGLQKMKLKLKKGNVKMKLNAGLGNIYLRKK
ncbi:MAG: hypothetical protein AB8B78_09685 [Polaribacter sp.]